MHPMFVRLFIETDADDLIEEQDKQRHARRARRGRQARVVRTAAPGPDRTRRP
jgi:hypothetical protein